jgi:nucleotide-binding universal stress UspA family protein
MNKTIMLAVDTARGELSEHVTAAVAMAKELAGPEDTVIVLHVHEFACSRVGRVQVDCLDGEGEQLVSDIVADLGRSGVTASGMIKEATLGHVARTILTAATQADVRVLVLGSSSRTDLPWISFGSVSGRLLHLSSLPVLIVPMHPRGAGVQQAVADTAKAGATAG